MIRNITLRHIAIAMAALDVAGGAAIAVASVPQQHGQVRVARDGSYCVNEGVFTGSRIPTIECKTVADWAELGVTFKRG
jgi:hypothetical protein